MIPEEETTLFPFTRVERVKKSEIECFQYAVSFFGITPTLPLDQLAPFTGRLEAFRLELLREGFRVMLWYAINGRFVAA